MTSVNDGSVKHLARVRALLAKAESTTFEQEADALTAKAQELISKYSLETLLAGAAHEQATGRCDVGTRNLVLHAPYVSAKASLVDAVAAANRCRCIFTPTESLVTLVGAPSDLEAVDLLTTSLLTQAEIAMRRHRDQATSWDSHTKSFRRAFLLSFAVRIRQRLLEATAVAVTESDDRDRLLPVLTRHAADVDRRVRELFPSITKSRRTTVSNHAGWAAGRDAADRAQVDNRRPLQR